VAVNEISVEYAKCKFIDENEFDATPEYEFIFKNSR
jgi:hypothetical protein